LAAFRQKRCKKAEAALQALEHRNRVLGNSAPFGIMAVDFSGRVEGLKSPDAGVAAVPSGADPEGMNVFDFPALAEAGISDDFRRCMHLNRSLVRDYACIDNRGSCLQLRFYISPVSDGGHSVSGAIVFVENYTNIKQAQTAAEQSEQRYRLLFQSAPVAMVERDASELKSFLEQLRRSGIEDLKAHFQKNPEEINRCMELVKTVDCNDAFIELLEAGSKKALMADLPQLALGTGFLQTAEKVILMLVEGRFPPERELTIQTLQGKRKRVMARVMVLAGHEDTLSRIVVSLVDISKRVEIEEALRASEKRFREQSLRDNLTGLYNQRYLYHSYPSCCMPPKRTRPRFRWFSWTWTISKRW